ncbi:hypothetical protein [Sphingobacterium siyangense]|uniref:hypothetical protein n=1 Tax=Sphingobacterium siyangense TaxID=459529 RepID=UPI002FDCC519
MKKLLHLLILFFAFTMAKAQTADDKAKAYYQEAQKAFENKNYKQTIDYCKQVTDLLKTSNARIELLRIKSYYELGEYDKVKASIKDFTNLQASAELKNEALEYLVKIEKAEKAAEEKRLAEQRRLEQERIAKEQKLAEEKLKKEEAEARKSTLPKKYEEMVYRLASEYPKTKLTTGEFITHATKKWGELKWFRAKNNANEYQPITEKVVKKIIKQGWSSFEGHSTIGASRLRFITLDNASVDRIKEYMVCTPIGKKRDLTAKDYCDILKISPQLWEDFTTGEIPLIKTVTREVGRGWGWKRKVYAITYTSHEGKKFDMGIHVFPSENGSDTNFYEKDVYIHENTL